MAERGRRGERHLVRDGDGKFRVLRCIIIAAAEFNRSAWRVSIPLGKLVTLWCMHPYVRALCYRTVILCSPGGLKDTGIAEASEKSATATSLLLWTPCDATVPV